MPSSPALRLDSSFNVHIANKSKASPDLRHLLLDIATASKYVSYAIQTTEHGLAGSENSHGEEQVALDVISDQIFQTAMQANTSVCAFASEEQPEIIPMHNNGSYTVVFDPLDGSSLVDANFSIGSIIGIYEGDTLVGKTPNQLVAAMYVLYGPRTVLVYSTGQGVHEFLLHDVGEYLLLRDNLTIKNKATTFSPGNIRAMATNQPYKELLNHWLEKQATLRHSGCMVPDVHHIFAKGQGIFLNLPGKTYPHGKLRHVFECGPFAYLIEQAGGASSNGTQSLLTVPIESLEQRTPIIVGSPDEVAMVEAYLAESTSQ